MPWNARWPREQSTDGAAEDAGWGTIRGPRDGKSQAHLGVHPEQRGAWSHGCFGAHPRPSYVRSPFSAAL